MGQNNSKPKKINDKQKAAEAFYKDALKILNTSGVPYLLGGGFAHKQYTGIFRDTKDLDIFCKSGDYPRILKILAENGYELEVTDARWLAKVKKGEHFIDIIFSNPGGLCAVDDTWFEHAVKGEVWGLPVLFMAPEELIWCKIYVQNRERYDGSDINHVMLRYGDKIDWKRLWMHMEQHWQLLLAQFLNFQFVYPSDRDIIPRWLFDELLKRAQEQFDMPTSLERVCRGPLIDQTQYATDSTEWDYKVVTMRSV
ncbi:nucleotidyltransferase [Pontibacter beigongshangensis]|uniref:nucleotidyltransferase n=1 Tax=Pontibacter beigongshangensis TaxID=2574733 RepID=UPI0016504FB6|nr:nucleotidyltransferase [Pontibacter beigongshangensis]